MDNFDFVEHLANTAQEYDASVEVVESFIRSYYRDMQAVETTWFGRHDESGYELAFDEINAVFSRYWLAGTRFAEYWQPSMGSPADFDITNDGGVTINQDMLGNFVAIVRANDRQSVYLLSVVRDELKIINQFF